MASNSNPNCPNSIEGSNSKLRAYNNDDGTQIDRISDLPDSILCHILSFLPTKDAAKTSFLSGRWGSVFWSNPISKLDFNDDQMDKAQFVDFVEEVLFNCVLMDTALHTLRFSCTQMYEDRDVNGWIKVAARLNMRSLDLNVRISNPVWLGQSIGACSCLTALRLVDYPLCIPDSMCLPNLKSLNLKHIAFYKEMTVANLFNGCPVLEELVMVDCGVFARILEICIPTLKRLRMEDCSFQNIGDGFTAIRNYEIVLNTPALEEFYYCDLNAASRYTVKELNCISFVHLDVKASAEQEEEESTVNFGLSVAELVMACSNTKYLYLSERSMLAIEYSHGLLTLFPNLKSLEVDVLSPRKWGLLLHLLDCAPDIFSLCVELGLGEYDWFADFNPPLASRLPACFAKNFGKCSILNFSGADQEFSFVAYFLKHANYLQKMVISFDSVVSMDYQLQIKENLLNLPRCSEACEVVFRTHVGETGAEFQHVSSM